jgi:methylmalonyl-CoA mutase N-terminal domain/subunit
LTKEIVERAEKYIEQIDAMGGAVAAIEKGFIQREISDSAYRHQKDVEAKKRIVVGVNEFRTEDEVPIKTLQIDPEGEKKLAERLRQIKRERNQPKMGEVLDNLRRAAEDERANLMPFVLQAVKEYATLGEICGTLREVFGEHKPASIF